jgi:Protein of unknown function (DUF4238)
MKGQPAENVPLVDSPMKKRQHFVPQFYLRQFASLGPREEIWTYDAKMGTVRSSTVASTGFEGISTVRSSVVGHASMT